MENPRLTFASPSLIAGDKSMTDVIAHEISHSWFGNLVTNATWSDFFLNEGFTMYAQRRIMAKVHGQSLADIEATTGQALLAKEIRALGSDSPLTRLRVPLEEGIDPGDCYNECAYEKGYAFVCYLRSLVESDALFDEFLRAYCERFRFQSIHAEQMIEFYFEYFPQLGNAKGDDFKDGLISWKVWLHNPGEPEYIPELTAARTLVEPAEALATGWCSGEPVSDALIATSNEMTTWPLFQKMHFLDACLKRANSTILPSEKLGQFGAACGVRLTSNPEIQFRWVQLVIQVEATDLFSDVEEFLTLHGKQKYLIPIYRALFTSPVPEARQLANDMYAKTAPRLHVMVRQRIERLTSQ